MVMVTDAQYRDIQTVVDHVLDRLAAMGLALMVEVDFHAWVEVMRSAPGIASISTTFDPAHSTVGPHDAYWLAVREDGGRIVATQAFRRFQTDDFLELIRSWRLFFDRGPVLRHRPMHLDVPNDLPDIRGNCIYTGGLWVHPDWRGRDLASLLPRISRALSLRHFAMDWVVGLVRDTDRRDAWARGWGITDCVPCIVGFFPPYGREIEGGYRLNFTNRWQMLEQIRSLAEEMRTHEDAPEGVTGQDPESRMARA